MSLAVNVICRNLGEDRVIPRFSRYLHQVLGWELTAKPVPGADLYYLSGYFESQAVHPWPDRPVAAYFTHREADPPGNGKAKLFDGMAQRVSLRVATAAMYAEVLTPYGPTAQINPPVERERFTLPRARGGKHLVAGFSGFTYLNRRKGEDIAREVVRAFPGLEWRGSGRGWPVPTREYPWEEMPAFYQSLDILVITARVEGVPMPALEALSCGVSLVIPRGVGLLDELPDTPGLYRYKAGSGRDCVTALRQAVDGRPGVDRGRLNALTDPYTVGAWCEQHRFAIQEMVMPCC